MPSDCPWNARLAVWWLSIVLDLVFACTKQPPRLPRFHFDPIVLTGCLLPLVDSFACLHPVTALFAVKNLEKVVQVIGTRRESPNTLQQVRTSCLGRACATPAGPVSDGLPLPGLSAATMAVICIRCHDGCRV